MADLFTRLARRTLGLMPVVQPRIASRFAPEEAMANENANIEIPSLFEGDGSLGPSQQTVAALSPSESGLREREEESITKTILVEIEGESPEKQELTPEGSSSSEERKETREEDKGKRETKAIEVASRKEKSLEVERVRELESPASNNREVKDLGRKEKSLEVERVRGLESPASNDRETKDLGRKEKSLEVERVRGLESPASNNREVKDLGRKEQSLEVERVRELESPASNNREVKDLGKKDHRDFPREEVLKSVIQTRAIEQKPGSVQWSSLGNESESRDLESYQKREGAKQIASPTESWRESSRYNSEERAIAPQEEVTSAEVASRKEQSLEVERVRELESPASNNREVKDLGKKDHRDFPREEVLKSVIQTRAIGQKPGSVQWSSPGDEPESGDLESYQEREGAEQIASPTESWRESSRYNREERAMAPQEEVTSAEVASRKEKSLLLERVRGLESPASNNREVKDLSSRREEKLSQFAPETVIELTEKGGETGKTETDRPVLEDDKTGNNLLQLLESKLAKERKAPVASTPTIQVTVGKIEVRGTKPAAKPVQQSRRKQSTVSRPKLSLDEYLKQRDGRKI